MEIYAISHDVIDGATATTFWYKGTWKGGLPLPPIQYGVAIKVDGIESESLGFDKEWKARNAARALIKNLLDQSVPVKGKYRIGHR